VSPVPGARFRHLESDVTGSRPDGGRRLSSHASPPRTCADPRPRPQRADPALVIELNPDALAIARERDRERGSGHTRGPCTDARAHQGQHRDSRPNGHDCGIARLDGVRQRATPTSSCGCATRRGDPRQDQLSEWANCARRTQRAAGARAAGSPAIRMRSTATPAARAPARAPRSRRASRRSRSARKPTARSSPRVGQRAGRPQATVGLVSRDGIIPISHTQDTAGRWRAPSRTRPRCWTPSPDRTSATVRPRTRPLPAPRRPRRGPAAWRPPRRPTRALRLDPAVVAVIGRALAVLETQGAVLVDPVELAWPARRMRPSSRSSCTS